MAASAHHKLATAIRGLGKRQIDYSVNPPSYATVLSISPLQVELQESGLRFDEDSITLAQGVLQYDADYGLGVGDVLVVAQMKGDDIVAQSVISDTEVGGTDNSWGDIDGGAADSNYGGTTPVDCGTA
jgi:hypothetical protein